MYLIEKEEKTIFIKNVLPVNGNGRNKKSVGAREKQLEKGQKKRGLKTVSSYWKFYPIESEQKTKEKKIRSKSFGDVDAWSHTKSTFSAHTSKQPWKS